MKKILLYLAALLAFIMLGTSQLTAQSDYTRKLSPFVRSLMTKAAKAKAKGQQPQAQYIKAFVKTSDPSALTEAGCTIHDASGDICIATIPLASLESLARQQSVERIEASRAPKAKLDTVSTIVNALPAYAGTALPQAYTGKNVVVGVMDGDFDLTHPTLYSADHSAYRVKYLWDMLDTCSTGAAAPYGSIGRLYTSEDELLEKGASTSTGDTHGTHCVGIAAGSGYGTPYRGMAYESDIALVSNTMDGIQSGDGLFFTNADNALGLKYIFAQAEAEGKPCVVSLSQGRNLTMEGKETLEEEYISSLLGEGRILVACAGNEASNPCYMKKAADDEAAGTTLASSDKMIYATLLASDHFKMRFVFFDDELSEADTLTVATDSLADGLHKFTFAPKSTATRYTMEFAPIASEFAPTKKCFEIAITSPFEGIGNTEPISLELLGEGVEAECYCNPENSTEMNVWKDDLPMLTDADCSHSINSPGIINEAICVGATAYRQTYYSTIFEQPNTDDNGTGGLRATFSSLGPAFDGRIKPDVMAPGTNIRSSQSYYWMQEQLKLEDADEMERELKTITDLTAEGGRAYPWGAFSGTSMATPAVAGSIALWLQANPKLTSGECKEIFAKTCRRPDASLSYPNIEYGYGEIDVYAGLLEVLKLPSAIKGLSTHQPAALSFALQGRQLRIAGAPEGKPYTVRLYTTGGQLLYQQRFAGGEATISLEKMPSGVLAVQVDGATAASTGSTLIRL